MKRCLPLVLCALAACDAAETPATPDAMPDGADAEMGSPDASPRDTAPPMDGSPSDALASDILPPDARAPDGMPPADMTPGDMAPGDMAPETTPDGLPPDAAPDGGPPAAEATLVGDCDPGVDRPGARCERVRVEVDGLPPIDAVLRISEADPARGAVVFGSGTGGGAWVLDGMVDSDLARLADDLVADGLTVIERAWSGGDPGGWFGGGAGGLTLHADRYAALARWIRDRYVPRGGALCVTGNSGGSVELGYALFRGLGRIAAVVVPTSGPANDLRDACWGEVDRPDYFARCEAWWSAQAAAGATTCAAGGRRCAFGGGARNLIDAAFGEGVDPCNPQGGARDGPSDEALALLADDAPRVPGQRARPVIRVLLGDGDCSGVVPEGAFWAERLAAAGLDASWALLPETRHNVLSFPDGAAAMRAILEAHCR